MAPKSQRDAAQRVTLIAVHLLYMLQDDILPAKLALDLNFHKQDTTQTKGKTSEVLCYIKPVYINGPRPVVYLRVQLDIRKNVPKSRIGTAIVAGGLGYKVGQKHRNFQEKIKKKKRKYGNKKMYLEVPNGIN